MRYPILTDAENAAHGVLKDLLDRYAQSSRHSDRGNGRSCYSKGQHLLVLFQLNVPPSVLLYSLVDKFFLFGKGLS